MDRLFGTGLVLDISEKVGAHSIITPEHCQEAADEAGLEIREGDILVLYTGWMEYFLNGEHPNELTYFARHPGPHKAFTDWWIDMDFPWVGNDTPAIEHPLNTAIRDYRPDLDLAGEFLKALSNSAGIDLHVTLHYGTDIHHAIEAIFKALGRALRVAVTVDPRIEGVMSTKGKL